MRIEELISPSLMEKKIVSVPLKLISSTDINPRKGGVCKDNIDSLVMAGDFPEIHLGYFDNELIIVDGYHRFNATQKLERSDINAFIIEYGSMEEMKKAAFIANVNHGLKLSDLDIALNIYDFYVGRVQKNPTTTLSSIIKEHSVPERAGRILFFWTVINREVLGNTSSDLSNKSKCETYSWLLSQFKEEPGSISDMFKDMFKRFYIKHDHLGREQLREAMRCLVEGKDYFEEVARQEAIVSEMEKADADARRDEVEVIDPDDLVDREGNVSYEQPTGSNSAVEELIKESEDLKGEAAEVAENGANSLQSATNNIKDIGAKTMLMRKLQLSKKITFTEDDYESISSIMDVLNEIIVDIDKNKFDKKEMI